MYTDPFSSGILSRPLSIGGNKDCWGLPNEARRSESRGRRPTAGVVFLWRGSKPPPYQLGDFGERCELTQRAGFGAEPRPPKGFPLFSALRMVSPDTIILLIVDHKKNEIFIKYNRRAVSQQ